MQTDTERSLVDMLEDTESAHSAYEMNELGERDQDWPIWYATYLFDNGVAELLPAIGHWDISGLASFLAQLDEEYQRETPAESWYEFYARRLIDEAGGTAREGLAR